MRRESLDDGWVELHDASGEGGNPFLCVLEKDGTERTVQLAAGDEPPRVVVREQRVRSDT